MGDPSNLKKGISHLGTQYWIKNNLKLSSKNPSNKEFRINPNIAYNPNPKFHRQFFELVQKYDDENLKFFSGKLENPNKLPNLNTNS